MTDTIFFDLDGTLVDSVPGVQYAIQKAWQTIYPGIPCEDIRKLMGPPVREMFRRLAPRADEPIGKRLPLGIRFRRLANDHTLSRSHPSLTSTPGGECSLPGCHQQAQPAHAAHSQPLRLRRIFFSISLHRFAAAAVHLQGRGRANPRRATQYQPYHSGIGWRYRRRRSHRQRLRYEVRCLPRGIWLGQLVGLRGYGANTRRLRRTCQAAPQNIFDRLT